MRNKFFDTLLPIAKKDKRVIVLMSDTGATVLQQWKEELPEQVINVGIAEQNMIGVAAGLAMEGFLPYCYGIIPFVTSRCHDQVRVDICCQRLPVTIVGVGTGYNYNTLGPTHHGVEDIAIMNALPGLSVYSPSDDWVTMEVAKYSYKYPQPTYVRVDRTGDPDFHTSFGCLPDSYFYKGDDYLMLSTGRISYHCWLVLNELEQKGISGTLIDVNRLKPFSMKLMNYVRDKFPYVITVEEHSVIGGLGSIAKDNGIKVDKVIAAPDKPVRIYGSREHLKASVGLDNDSVIKSILELVNDK